MKRGRKVPKSARIIILSVVIALVLVVVCMIASKNVPVPYRVSIDGEIVPDYTVYRVNGCLYAPVIDTLKVAGYTVHTTDRERCYEVIINDEPYYYDLNGGCIYDKEGNPVNTIRGGICGGPDPVYVSVPGKGNDLVAAYLVIDNIFCRFFPNGIGPDETNYIHTKNRIYYFVR